MEENWFSIIVPVYNKEETLARCLQSLVSQTYGNFEVVIIDDKSTDKSKEVILSFLRDKRFKAYFLAQNQGRLVARNTGMRMARNKWICWLDADDEYMTNYLEVVDNEINRNPNHKLFNFGMLVKDREVVGDKTYENGWRITNPLKLEEKEKGHASFLKGQIGSGSFVFDRSLLNEVGYFPEDAKNPEGGENSLPACWVKRDSNMKEICKQNDSGTWLPLGNPWGDDYSFFWRLTRNNKTKTINTLLYIQHVRK